MDNVRSRNDKNVRSHVRKLRENEFDQLCPVDRLSVLRMGLRKDHGSRCVVCGYVFRKFQILDSKFVTVFYVLRQFSAQLGKLST